MKEAFRYEDIKNKSKIERRTAAMDAGILDERRFLLPSDPIVRERIRVLKNSVSEFKRNHPEVVSFGFFGSNTKGYATPESDIDGALYVDLHKAAAEYRKHHDAASPKEMMGGIKSELAAEFKKNFVHDAGIKPEQAGHATVYLVSEATIHKILNLQPENRQAIEELFVLFLLQIGSGIEKYRKAVLEELESQGDSGQQKWRIISARLAKFENATRNDDEATAAAVARREHLYPQNLQDARRVFLKEQPKIGELKQAA